jgi:6-phosphogluconolactonase
MPDIKIYADAEALAWGAADFFVRHAQQTIAARERFSVALSGGSTPKALYELLATDAFAQRVDWRCVYVFWGDERCVPADHLDSCYRMAREALLDHIPLPAENIYRIRGEEEPAKAAAEYDEILRRFFGETAGARFDLVWLGMGDDGHTASLFPGTEVLHERERWVKANFVPAARQRWRITLTPPAINAASNIAFLVSGAGKAERLRQVLKGEYQPDMLPSQLVNPVNGHLVWFVDRAAAALLE